MHDFQQESLCDGVFVIIFFKTMYNNTITWFGFCDIRNTQGLIKLVLSASAISSADNAYLDLDDSRYHKKTSSNKRL